MGTGKIHYYSSAKTWWVWLFTHRGNVYINYHHSQHSNNITGEKVERMQESENRKNTVQCCPLDIKSVLHVNSQHCGSLCKTFTRLSPLKISSWSGQGPQASPSWEVDGSLWLLGEGGSLLFRNTATGNFPTTQWTTPPPCVYVQHYCTPWVKIIKQINKYINKQEDMKLVGKCGEGSCRELEEERQGWKG